jgi:hypothetical protein
VVLASTIVIYVATVESSKKIDRLSNTTAKLGTSIDYLVKSADKATVEIEKGNKLISENNNIIRALVKRELQYNKPPVKSITGKR